MPPKRRNSLVIKEEPKTVPIPVKIEPVSTTEDSENANKRVRRTRASSGTSNATSTTSDQITISHIQHTDNMDLYLQDLFYTICTHKDASSPRLLAVVFYLLPSQKVC